MAGTLFELYIATAVPGDAPTFTTFAAIPGGAALTPPVLTDKGDGRYWYSVDWSTIGASTISFIATLARTGEKNYGQISGTAAPIPIVSGSATQPLGLYPTAKTVLNRAALQCQIVSAAVDDPYAQTDQQWALLRELLVTLADDLQENGWAHLVKLATFTTAGAASSYALPADYHELQDQTLWNRSTRLPGIGPLSYQQAAFLQARLANVQFSLTYQLAGGLLLFPVVPPDGTQGAFYYGSSYWVQSSGAPSPDKDRPTASDDVLLFDEELLVLGLKLKYLEEKGFDTSKVQDRFDSKLEHVIGKNKGAPVLGLSGPGNAIDPLIDGDRNMPMTGYGQV